MQCNIKCELYEEGGGVAPLHIEDKVIQHCVYRHQMMLGRGEYERTVNESGDISGTYCYNGRIVGGGGVKNNNPEHDKWSLNDKRKQTKMIKCFECGAEMVLRTARRGENVGKQFYGCSNYPICKETEDYPYKQKDQDLTLEKRDEENHDLRKSKGLEEGKNIKNKHKIIEY